MFDIDERARVRKQVVDRLRSGVPLKQVADECGVHPSDASRWLRVDNDKDKMAKRFADALMLFKVRPDLDRHQIAEKVKLSHGTIAQLAKEHGHTLPRKKHDTTYMRNPREDEVVQRVRDGKESLQAIGDDLGLTRERIRQIAKKHGVVSVRSPKSLQRQADSSARK